MNTSHRGLASFSHRLQCRSLTSTARLARKPARPQTVKQQQQPVPNISREYKPQDNICPPPPPQQLPTLRDQWSSSWLPLSGAAIVAGLMGFYVLGTLTASLKSTTTPCCSHDHADETPTGRPLAMTADNAEQFDKELNFPEWWMGITSLRRRLADRANGTVLELAMGSGRNLEYYNWEPLTSAAADDRSSSSSSDDQPRGITSFTGLDISADMLDVARRKLTRAHGRAALVPRRAPPAGALGRPQPLPLPPPREGVPKYDTIVQTFGLCSVSDPVAVVSNLATAVKPGTGRIILLEHGKGWYGIVNGLLDRNAGQHFEKYGCWWNRDIQALVEEAARKTPGLEVVKVERPFLLQMGTLLWIELKMNPTPQ
uniref:Methyltransferase domain-containing protein n=1 Tax=Bionectria ochroleuca TaxID=29856 RepID=A0A8H7NF65_BIOOC